MSRIKSENPIDKFKVRENVSRTRRPLYRGRRRSGKRSARGPVVCAAVVMPLEEGLIVEGVDDSKKLSPKKREALAAWIKERALAYTVYEVSEKVIDEINILQATRLGMKNALLSLKLRPDTVITDGNMTLEIPFPQHSIVHGDALSYSIGAASIVAKVYRDALMDEFFENISRLRLQTQ